MNLRVWIPIVLLVVGLAGCATPSRTPVPAAAPAGSNAAGFFPLWIESEPAGATVVVDGIPQGRTPLLIRVPGTPRGFFRTETSIRVRFIAADADQLSTTTDEVFAPTDRIPTRLDYTPAGVRRTR